MTDIKNDRPENCDHTALLDYLEGRLSDERATALESHVSECALCSSELEMMKKADDLLQRYSFCLAPEPSEFDVRLSETTRGELPPKLLQEYERSHGVKEGLLARFFAAIGFKPVPALAVGAVAAAVLVAVMIHPIMESFRQVSKEIPKPETTEDQKEAPTRQFEGAIKHDLEARPESKADRNSDLRDSREVDERVEGHTDLGYLPPSQPEVSPRREARHSYRRAPGAGSYSRVQPEASPAEVLPEAPGAEAPRDKAEKPVPMLEKRAAKKHEIKPLLIAITDEQGNPIDLRPEDRKAPDELALSYAAVEKRKRSDPGARFYELKIQIKKTGETNDLTAQLVNPQGEEERTFHWVDVETKNLRPAVDSIIHEIRDDS